MSYAPRLVDGVLSDYLGIAGAVLIEGVRACGKTETGSQHAASVVNLDVDDDLRALAQIDPSLVLDGATPRLLDEWQLVPGIWNHVRRTVDRRRQPGQFILAGSATPSDDVTRHSGAGRILRLRMRPMSLVESGLSSGEVSLSDVMAGKAVRPCSTSATVADIVNALCRGGWPGLQHLNPDHALIVLQSYLDDVARADLSMVAPNGRDPLRVRRVLNAYARHVATPASVATITADTRGAGFPAVRPETTSDYLSLLERTMTIEEQASWGPHLRSRDRVRQGAIRHFVDPSLAVAALEASPQRLLRDIRTLGLLFESLVVRDLRVYTQGARGEVRHYRDSAGLEADAILDFRDGRWAAVEVKLGANQVDQAVSSLHRLVSKIDTSVSGEPAARIVITASQHAYTRPDGIHVIPLTLLGP